MEEFNNTAFYKRALLKGGKSLTYTKVKMALAGAKQITDEKEKKQLLHVLEEVYKLAKENILKS
jgi:hypothetical protein